MQVSQWYDNACPHLKRIYSFHLRAEWGRKGEDRFSIECFAPKMPLYLGLRQVEIINQVLHVDLSHWCHKLKQLDHYLLSPRHIRRDLDQRHRWLEFEPGTWDAGIPNRGLTFFFFPPAFPTFSFSNRYITKLHCLNSLCFGKALYLYAYIYFA